MIPSWAWSAISRMAAAVAAAVAIFLIEKVGLPVEVVEEHRALLEGGITFVGVVLFVLLYGLLRPIISRFVHPADTASSAPKPPPENVK